LLSLKEVVHFYNTRDAYPGAFVNGQCRPGTVRKPATPGAVNCNCPGFAVEPATLYLRRGDLPRLGISTVNRVVMTQDNAR
jgi:hypothetical protein